MIVNSRVENVQREFANNGQKANESNQSVVVDESFTLNFEDNAKVKSDPDSVNIEKIKADFLATIGNNLEKIRRLEEEQNVCRTEMISKCKELDVTKAQLNNVLKEKAELESNVEHLKKVNQDVEDENQRMEPNNRKSNLNKRIQRLDFATMVVSFFLFVIFASLYWIILH